MENAIKMDDLGGTIIFGNTHLVVRKPPFIDNLDDLEGEQSQLGDLLTQVKWALNKKRFKSPQSADGHKGAMCHVEMHSEP